MKKLLTLCAAVLASLSLWAAATHTSPATVSYAEKTFLDVANTPGNAGTDNEEYLTYGVQVMNNNYSSWAWFEISSGAWSKSNNSYSLPSGATGFCPAGSSSSSEFYGQINFKANDNSKTGQIDMYVTGLTEVGFVWKNNNTSNNRWMNYSVTEVASDGTLGTPRLKNGSTSSTSTQYDSIQGLDGEKYYKISMWTEGGSSSLVYTFTFKRYTGPSCTDPEAHLTFTKSTAYVDEQFSYNYGSKNGGALTTTYTLDGAPAVEGTDYTFTSGNITVLKAGQFVMRMTVDAQDGYCAVDVSDTILINEATAVESVTISGPTAAYVGEAVTFTATAANASDYAWEVDGVDANTNADKFTFTPAAAGEYSIVCKARNQFNAANEWIASKAKVLTASTVSGVLVSYTVNSDANGAANLTGAFAAKATAKVSLTKGSSQALDEYTGYKMDRGKYAGVTLTSGSFQEGDTVSFMVTKASGTAKLYLYDDEQGTNRLDSINFSGQTGWATFILNQATAGVYLYRSNPDVKPYDQNPYVAALKVIRPKIVKSTSELLKAATIDGDTISAAELTSLKADESLDIATSYLNAPVVVFIKTVTTTYDDDTNDGGKDVDIEVEATVNDEGKWAASATINETEYTITMAKTASFTVIYKLGDDTLGTELVAENGNPTGYATYQSLNDGGLSTFNGWYSNADLADEHAVADMSAEEITADVTYYASFTYKYATSVNIEQLILDNGTGYNIKTGVINGNNGFASNYSSGDISNDSLKALADAADRNYPYLGLKVKVAGALLNFRLAEGKTLNIKIGAIKSEKPQVSINGGAYANMDLTTLYADQAETVKYYVYTHTAEAEELISIKTAAANAVVFKQIMIDEDIQEFVLPALYTVTFNAGAGTCATETISTQFGGDKIVLPAATAPSGYKLVGWFTDASEGEEVGKAEAEYTPTADITLYAQYSETTAIGNTEAAVKAVKVIRDGQVLIIREGKTFNVMGAEVK